jgi:hypothetical protein
MNRKPFFRSPLFWVGLLAISIGSIIFLYYNFEKANPLVNISVEMNRDEALKLSAQLAEKYNLGPKQFKQAASFRNDTPFQNYTELEGGGLKQFNRITGEGIYESYQWKVRNFKENEVNEVIFFLTPKGKPYGFSEKISEDLPGNNLSSDSALTVARKALSDWKMDMTNYELAEKKVTEKPGGRLDHEFVFERTDIRVNESKFRISVAVSGDKVTKIENSVKVPDDFERRYSEMRSENDLISTIGFAILYLVYGLIAVGFGLLFLMRRRFIVWKKALFWSLAIGLGTGILYVLNVFPLLWFNYDTSSSAASFIGRKLVNGFLNTLLMSGIVFLSAMAGEGMGRYLFPGHLQFWKIWCKDSGGSRQVLGQTIGAYLFVPVFLAIDVLYYLISTKYGGWWNPAGTLSDPDVLAQNLPWFSPIAMALQAGFWEEFICRAVPLAGVYLIVRNLKTRNLWMILTLFVQTIIFGMLHANYPQSPSYARVLEMIIPFLIFGLIYLRFGILPLIITHFAVDVFWMSLPIWVASTPGIWTNRFMVTALFLMPLFVVIYWRLKNKKWTEAPVSAFNRSWKPVPKTEKVETPEEDENLQDISRKSIFLQFKWLILAAVTGIVIWAIVMLPKKYDNPEVKVNRVEAVEISKNILKDKFGFTPDGWRVLTSIKNNPSDEHKFVWQVDNTKYKDLTKSFLFPPYWLVRFVNTNATVEERAEEYIVKIGVDKRVLGYSHCWPEKRKGTDLDEKAALEKAKIGLESFIGGNSNNFKVIKIEPEKTDWRTNWKVEFSDTINYSLSKGMGLYKIGLSGDEISEVGSYVNVSEEWQRNTDRHKSTLKIFTLISNLIVYLVLIFGIIMGVINWTRKKFSGKMFLLFGVGFLIISFAGILNSWNMILSSYFTGLPFGNFITMTIIGIIIGILFMATGVAVIGGFSCQLAIYDRKEEKPWVKATLVGVFITGLYLIKTVLIPKTGPEWIELGNMNDSLPAFGLFNDNLSKMIFNPAFAMILFYFVNQFSRQFTKRRVWAILSIFAAGFLIAGSGSETIQSWIISGLDNAILFTILFILLHKNISWLPIVFFITLLLSNFGLALNGHFNGLISGIILTIVAGFLISFGWQSGIEKCNKLN